MDSVQIYYEGLTTFLLGCSFTLDAVLEFNNVPAQHHLRKTNVPMYITKVQTESHGRFSGPMVVSARAFKKEDEAKVREISKKYPEAHGEPLDLTV